MTTPDDAPSYAPEVMHTAPLEAASADDVIVILITVALVVTDATTLISDRLCAAAP